MSRAERIIFIVWSSRTGRAEDVANFIGGEAVGIFPQFLKSRRLIAARYLASAVLTIFQIIKKRPSAVIVTNPPIFAAVVVAGVCMSVRCPFVLDSHPTAFGAKNHTLSRRLMFLHRFVAKKAKAVLVASDEWKNVVENWAANPIIFHEAPPRWKVSTPRGVSGRPSVLFIGIFGGDEPVLEVVNAARQVEGIDFSITGDLSRAPHDLVRHVPTNVTFTGYLSGSEYSDAIDRADIVLALTTEPTSVMRAAYEAVYCRRPLVITGTEILKALFPWAIHVENSADDIARGLNEAVARYDELIACVDDAYSMQLSRWVDQFEALKSAWD